MIMSRNIVTPDNIIRKRTRRWKEVTVQLPAQHYFWMQLCKLHANLRPVGRSSCASKVNSAFNYLIYLRNTNEYIALAIPMKRETVTLDRMFDDTFAHDTRETIYSAFSASRKPYFNVSTAGEMRSQTSIQYFDDMVTQVTLLFE